MRQNRSQNSGFTLIELLIVIVLIGILTVILITIINPEEKQNMANDATIFSTLSKIVLSTEGFISAYGRVPDEQEFTHSLTFKVRELFGRECSYAFVPDYECLFFVDGINLPQNCDLTFWAGEDNNNQLCNFRYQGEIAGNPNRFRLYIKSMGIAETIFVYDNLEGGKLFKCPTDINDLTSLTDNCE